MTASQSKILYKHHQVLSDFMKSNLRSDTRIENSKWFLFAVVIFYLFVAYNSTGYHNPDEHFQIIEFANYKLGLATLSDLAWEYNAQIRSGIQPGLCFFIFKLLRSIGITDVYFLSFALRALTAIFAVFAIKGFINANSDSIERKNHLAYVLISYFLWFLPFINVRFSSESWSGLFFLLSLSIVQNSESRSPQKDVLLGALLGMAFLFRYQSGMFIAGIGLWLIFIERTKFARLVLMVAAGLAVLLIGVLADKWLYGQFTFAPYNYFKANIIQDIASQYGVSPWYEIIRYIVNGPGPIGIFILLSYIILLVRRPKHIVIWASLPFLLVHAIIAHKELRFVFPLANLAPLVLMLGFQEASSIVKLIKPKWIFNAALVILAITDIAGLIVVSTKSAGNAKISIAQYIDRHYRNKRVNLLYREGLNPYSNWPVPINTFYRNNNVDLTEIVTIWESDLTKKKKKGYTNLVTISNNDITGPKTIALIKQLNLVEVHQSIPWIDQKILALYNRSFNDDNQILYEFRE